MAPHSGQSSQLPLDANDRNAKFLSKVARSALASDPHSAQSSQSACDSPEWIIFATLFLTRTTRNRLLACGRAAAEADDVAIRVLDIEALRGPVGRHDRLNDRHAVGDALLVERLDAVDTRRGVKMIVVRLCWRSASFLSASFK